MRQLFIVAPARNEAASIAAFVLAVSRTIQDPTLSDSVVELVLVDDGSTDDTLGAIRNLAVTSQTPTFQIVAVELSRNFGHQAAIHAGLTVAFNRARKGADFIVLDSDLEHPPEYIPTIVGLLRSGKDHVQMVRQEHAASQTPRAKSLTSRLFYHVFRVLTGIPLLAGSADYRGMSHAVVKSFLDMPETDRFNRGLFWWVGFKRAAVPYVVGARIAGETKYSWSHMLYLAMTGITSFSSRPLFLTLGGTVAMAFAFCGAYLAFEAYRLYVLRLPFVAGWPSLLFVITFWGGVISFGQLLLAIYVARVFAETKGRPSFIVRAIHESAQLEPTLPAMTATSRQ